MIPNFQRWARKVIGECNLVNLPERGGFQGVKKNGHLLFRRGCHWGGGGRQTIGGVYSSEINLKPLRRLKSHNSTQLLDGKGDKRTHGIQW